MAGPSRLGRVNASSESTAFYPSEDGYQRVDRAGTDPIQLVSHKVGVHDPADLQNWLTVRRTQPTLLHLNKERHRVGTPTKRRGHREEADAKTEDNEQMQKGMESNRF